ncbi:hypothetical protein LIER_09039 [Lithospermum erythrorhizon]|uniref:Uncharacterized protein n=1 Tax=Lithospermum erythrorhizon TaxID=34254 RepID=A0AAV3PH34_LITER
MEEEDLNDASDDNIDEIGHDSDHPSDQLNNMGEMDTHGTHGGVQFQPTTCTSTRTRITSTRYPPHDYVLIMDEGEPTCYQESIEREDKLEWMDAMKDEMDSLKKNNTFILVERIPGQKRF